MNNQDNAEKSLPAQVIDLPSRLARGLISLYKKFISPLLPPACRFHPTCSQYCSEALEKHGFFKGGWIGMKRILRCNPFFKGGYDPVPGNKRAVPAPGESKKEQGPERRLEKYETPKCEKCTTTS